ncbi:uncharacterized protein [Macrobrachium rosenbergii]|uniref:uncharacterized protein n=1 Tax=Macrobrachium rosenbergii TaxID=79674 RepID=UPI0034D59110
MPHLSPWGLPPQCLSLGIASPVCCPGGSLPQCDPKQETEKLKQNLVNSGDPGGRGSITMFPRTERTGRRRKKKRRRGRRERKKEKRRRGQRKGKKERRRRGDEEKRTNKGKKRSKRKGLITLEEEEKKGKEKVRRKGTKAIGV